MPGSTFRLSAFVALVALVTACAPDESEFEFGIPAFHLETASSDVARLENGTFTKTRVGAFVTAFGETWTGELSVAGRSSVDDAKKSYNLRRNGQKLRLNAMSRDASALRGSLAFRVFSEAGFVVPTPQYVAVFLNQRYLGLYSFHETYDQVFLEDQVGPIESIYAGRDRLATLSGSESVEIAFDARPGEYADLRALVSAVSDPDLQEVLDRIDVLSLLQYMAVSSFIDNGDGIDNNYNLVRTSDEPRFFVLPWDVDFSFRLQREQEGVLFFENNALMSRLAQSPEFREQYDCALARVHGRIDATFISDWLTENAEMIRAAYAADRFLGQSPDSIDEAVAQIISFREAQTRPECETQ